MVSPQDDGHQPTVRCFPHQGIQSAGDRPILLFSIAFFCHNNHPCPHHQAHHDSLRFDAAARIYFVQKKVNASHADYLFHFDDTRPYDLGEKTLNCGRHQDSFKAWLSWKVHGDNVRSSPMHHVYHAP